MHTFQPLPFDLVEFNPFTKIGKEWALVTAGNKEKANTMTVSWGGVGVLWGKNVAFIFVRDSRYTKEFIYANEFFSITFLSGQYRRVKLLRFPFRKRRRQVRRGRSYPRHAPQHPLRG